MERRNVITEYPSWNPVRDEGGAAVLSFPLNDTLC